THTIDGKQVAATVIEAVMQAASDLERTKDIKVGLALGILGDFRRVTPMSPPRLNAGRRDLPSGEFPRTRRW
ncbi:hypothetical protein NKJ90_32635, partial [Mesorhizobium sp. M0051]